MSFYEKQNLFEVHMGRDVMLLLDYTPTDRAHLMLFIEVLPDLICFSS